jgi:hypothetical protein
MDAYQIQRKSNFTIQARLILMEIKVLVLEEEVWVLIQLRFSKCFLVEEVWVVWEEVVWVEEEDSLLLLEWADSMLY